MRQRASLLWILLFGSLMAQGLTGCSQSASRASVHRYVDAGAGSLGVHTLRSGETLWSVANAYQVDLRDLLDINHLQAPYLLKNGQRLRIPAPMTYRAKSGDTLYKISRMFDTTTTELAQLNALRAPYAVQRDQIIRLPSKHPEASSRILRVAQSENSGGNRVGNRGAISSSSARIDREVLTSSVPAVASNKDSHVYVKTASAQEDPDTTPLQLGRQGFLKPVSGRVISSFGPKADGLHNDGVNIKAMRGDPVRCAEQGVVVYSGNQIEGYGNMVLVRHANGYMTAYAHMEKNLVRKGERIKRGQTIGTVGSTGHVNSPQLHFEIRKGKQALNPADFV